MLPPLRPAVVSAVLALALAAPSADAFFPQTTTGSVPAGGYGTVGSSPIPKNAKSAVISAQANVANADNDRVFNKLAKVLSSGTRGQGVVFCAITFALVSGGADLDSTDSKTHAELAYLLLNACIEMALQLGSKPAANPARISAAGCPRVDLAVPVKITRSAGKYRLKGTGKPKRSRRSPLVVSCRKTRHGFRMRLRPRSPKRSLRSVVGKKLTLGYVNPADNKTVNVKTTIDVK